MSLATDNHKSKVLFWLRVSSRRYVDFHVSLIHYLNPKVGLSRVSFFFKVNRILLRLTVVWRVVVIYDLPSPCYEDFKSPFNKSKILRHRLI